VARYCWLSASECVRKKDTAYVDAGRCASVKPGGGGAGDMSEILRGCITETGFTCAPDEVLKVHAEAALMVLMAAYRASDPIALKSCVQVDPHAQCICSSVLHVSVHLLRSTSSDVIR
jgi:hypothetical protein